MGDAQDQPARKKEETFWKVHIGVSWYNNSKEAMAVH